MPASPALTDCTPADSSPGAPPLFLTTRSVGSLVTTRPAFFIPKYQRGYRWERAQVTALLEDLWEYENQPDQAGQFYCLQPLVVLKRGDGRWEVVDGQQRLTTIFLILRHVAGETPLFQLQYERHPHTMAGGLEALLEMASTEASGRHSPDLYYLREAEIAIREWLAQHPAAAFPCLTHGDGICAKFIWHEIGCAKEAMRSFARLNGGKIKLIDAELIRATFVHRHQDAADRHRIALRWDEMERRLQQPEFWAFLNSERQAVECRISLLLGVAAPAPASADRAADHAVFDHFFQELKTRSPTHLWEEIEAIFGTFEQWFENNQLFHLTGFLIARGEPLRGLLEQARGRGKTEFIQFLKRRIRDLVFGKSITCAGAIGSRLGSLTYHAPRSVVLSTLLLYNLAALNADQTGTVRFSFHAYHTQGWDIEHIHASASRQPQSKGELKAAFGALEDYFDHTGRKDEGDQVRGLLKGLTTCPETDLMPFQQSYAELCQPLECGSDLTEPDPDEPAGETSPTDPRDRLWNLTLLDPKTNRGYGNSPFAVKREWILRVEQQARYILPCTRNVFTKACSPEPVNLLYWTRSDALNYQKSMRKTLEAFFQDTWTT